MGYFLAIRQLLIEEATDFMPVAVDLEEEARTPIPVVAIVLAIGNGSCDAVWPSIFGIGIADTIVASVSQRYLAVWHRYEVVGRVALVEVRLLADLTAGSMPMGNLLVIRQLLVEKTTNLMPIAMNLEEETLAAIPVVAFILAVRYSSISAVWPSILGICIADTVVASVSQ